MAMVGNFFATPFPWRVIDRFMATSQAEMKNWYAREDSNLRPAA